MLDIIDCNLLLKQSLVIGFITIDNCVEFERDNKAIDETWRRQRKNIKPSSLCNHKSSKSAGLVSCSLENEINEIEKLRETTEDCQLQLKKKRKKEAGDELVTEHILTRWIQFLHEQQLSVKGGINAVSFFWCPQLGHPFISTETNEIDIAAHNIWNLKIHKNI